MKTTAGRLRNLLFSLPPSGEVVFVLPDGRKLEIESFQPQADPGRDGRPVQTPATLLLGLKECAPAAAA